VFSAERLPSSLFSGQQLFTTSCSIEYVYPQMLSWLIVGVCKLTGGAIALRPEYRKETVQ